MSGVRGIAELLEHSGDEEGDLLPDVDSVVADPLDEAGHQVHLDGPPEHGLVVRGSEDLSKHSSVEPVDRLVPLCAGGLRREAQLACRSR